MTVIEGDVYRRERAALVTDPIILAIAEEMRGITSEEVSGWTFTIAAGRQYHRRGGTQAVSIGGPAAAIATVLGLHGEDS